MDSFLESFLESSPFLESFWFGEPFLARNVFPLLVDYAKTSIPRPFIVALFALPELYDSTTAGILVDTSLLRTTKFDPECSTLSTAPMKNRVSKRKEGRTPLSRCGWLSRRLGGFLRP